MQKPEKKIIGRVEKIDLPNLSLFNLDAKIDTGAYTSSLHCYKIEQFVKDGQNWVKFNVLDPDHPEYEGKLYESAVYKVKNVKSSNGQIEERVVIKQKTRFQKYNRTMELSLTNRSEMKYPVLIGRKFLAGSFLVDVSKKYLLK
ncbi:MAG: RimK/LysX family protein [Balneolaceae bacterium]|nr:RimK/LysX family protein [Balneolaceae bacterium]